MSTELKTVLRGHITHEKQLAIKKGTAGTGIPQEGANNRTELYPQSVQADSGKGRIERQQTSCFMPFFRKSAIERRGKPGLRQRNVGAFFHPNHCGHIRKMDSDGKKCWCKSPGQPKRTRNNPQPIRNQKKVRAVTISDYGPSCLMVPKARLELAQAFAH